MSDEERQVPPPLTEGGARIRERDPAGTFARLPADETHPVERPGSGPRGPVDGPLNIPLVVTAAGIALVFVTFVAGHWSPLAAGLVLVLVGAVWSLVRNRPIRLYRGVGTIRKPAGR